jgi:mRNA-degrading endonuclease RelE of RelBE toxin-antitoxin system
VDRVLEVEGGLLEAVYRIEVSEQAEDQLRDLDKPVRERVTKKIDEIQQRIQDLGMDPNRAVEKRLRSPFHRYLQQRVGDYRVWFVDIPEDEVLLVAYVWHKEEAQERLGG